MKGRRTQLLALTLLLGFSPQALGSGEPSPAVQKIEPFNDLYRHGAIYIAGQPSIEMLCWLKHQGVTLVVNLRTATENRNFTATNFDEAALAEELGLAYASLPIGSKEPGSPKTVEAFAHYLESAKGKTLLHCASGGRATNLWMAFLVRHGHMSLNEAAVLGRQMKFSMPLEELLGGTLSLQLIPTNP